jgi:hypothetical protein
MTTYTKQTIFTYQEPRDTLPLNYLTELSAKKNQMVTEGKTNGNYEFIDERTIRRIWLDQGAADEWVQFIVETSGQAELNNVVITDYLIGNNTDPV